MEHLDVTAWLSQDWVQHQEEVMQPSSSSSAKQPQLYSVKQWLVYLDAIDDAILETQQQERAQATTNANPTTATTPNTRTIQQQSSRLVQLQAARDWVGRRAVTVLPRSYKLWKQVYPYLIQLQHLQLSSQSSQPMVDAVTVQACFERALVTLSAYPRVWMDYMQWLCSAATATETPSYSNNNHDSNNNTAVDATRVRRTINRALQSVAVTQHEKLWKVILECLLLDASSKKNTAAAVATARITSGDNDSRGMATRSTAAVMPWPSVSRLLQRYCQFRPDYLPEYATLCEQHGQWGLAAAAYVQILNDTTGTVMVSSSSSNSGSRASSSQEQHWQSFCELVAQHSEQVTKVGIPWEAILQTAIRQQIQHQEQQQQQKKSDPNFSSDMVVTASNKGTTTMLGLLYSWLASAWVQRGDFDMARSVYEQGLRTVHTVRDFSILYTAYLALEEGLLTALSNAMTDDDDDGNDDDAMEEGIAAGGVGEEDDWDILLPASNTSANLSENQLAEMELAMARAEHLTARRPLLLNAVKLRQNPNDCAEWIVRGDLFVQSQQARQAATALEMALATIQGGTGLGAVVVRLVTLYMESLKDVGAARDLLNRVCIERSTAKGLTKTDDLAECWVAWIELELKEEKWDDALSLARQSVAGNSKATRGRRRLNLQKSLRLWDLLLDLEESLGTLQTTKDAYNRTLEIKVATVQHVLNFATFLIEHKYFEESLTVYERGIELFNFPHAGAKLLWKAYLKVFLDRFKGTKVERARNLFQRCLEDCPAEECAEFFTMNGAFEEEHGLTKRSLSVYADMCDRVPPADKYTAYQLFIVKTTQSRGVPATRAIYQEAIEKLKDPVSAVKMCADFAKMEIGLRQPERARAIYAHGAQSADPRRSPEYWKDWNDFEIEYGNEETFREMLRVKRTTEAAFSTVNYNASGMTDKVENFTNEEAMKMIASSEGMDVEETANATVVAGFVPSKRKAVAANLDDVEERVAKLRKATAQREDALDDEDEIDLDDLDAEIEEAAAEGESQMTANAADVKPEPIKNVSTKAVPAAVFGGLAPQKA